MCERRTARVVRALVAMVIVAGVGRTQPTGGGGAPPLTVGSNATAQQQVIDDAELVSLASGKAVFKSPLVDRMECQWATVKSFSAAKKDGSVWLVTCKAENGRGHDHHYADALVLNGEGLALSKDGRQVGAGKLAKAAVLMIEPAPAETWKGDLRVALKGKRGTADSDGAELELKVGGPVVLDALALNTRAKFSRDRVKNAQGVVTDTANQAEAELGLVKSLRTPGLGLKARVDLEHDRVNALDHRVACGPTVRWAPSVKHASDMLDWSVEGGLVYVMDRRTPPNVVDEYSTIAALIDASMTVKPASTWSFAVGAQYRPSIRRDRGHQQLTANAKLTIPCNERVSAELSGTAKQDTRRTAGERMDLTYNFGLVFPF